MVFKNLRYYNKTILKYVSLVILTLHSAILGLSMRYSRVRKGDMFRPSTAVLMTEVVKLLMCLSLVYFEEGNFRLFLTSLRNNVIKHPFDTLKVCVPSLAYIIQNNLLYVAATHLDAVTYQVSYQLRIIITALFTVLILRRTIQYRQWAALTILPIGVVLVQLAHTESSILPNNRQQSRLIGFSAAISACCLTGFAGVYFEKILKGSDLSVWMRNVQLSFLSLPFGLFTCFINDWNSIYQNGFFFGYDLFIWYLVVLQAGGGLIVATAVKYSDNILKNFATSLGIIILCVASIYLFNFHPSLQFEFGTGLVIFSTIMYSYTPAIKSKNLRLLKKI